jgi:hypothetical protein
MFQLKGNRFFERLFWRNVLLSICIIILSVSCNNRSNNIENELCYCNIVIGKWAVKGVSQMIEITNDSIFWKMCIDGNHFNFINSKYSCYSSNDTVLIKTVEDIPIRIKMLRIDDEHFALALFKSLKGTEDHVAHAFLVENYFDEKIGRDSRIKLERSHENTIKHDTYILPDGFTGVLAIAYNQSDGILPTYDSFGNKTFSLVNNTDFLVKIQSDLDIIGYATNKIGFFYSYSEDSAIALRSYQIFDKVPQEQHFKDNHVFLVGFNRIGRTSINRIINDNIEGNILFLKVSKDFAYSENALATDSVFFHGKYLKISNY